MQHETERSLLTLGAAAATTATTTVDGAAIDMSGFDGVVIFCTIGTANAGNFLKAQGGQQSNLSDAADLAGTKVTIDSNADLAILDVAKPKEQFIRGNIVRAGATTITGEMYYLRYNGSSQAVVNDILNTQNLVKVISPAEGTP